LRVGCIVWERNEDYLEEMVKFCKGLGVKNLRFSWLIRVGRFKVNPQLFPQKKWIEAAEEIKRLREKYKEEIKITAHRMPGERNASHFCPGGEKIFFIDSQGRISSCSWISKITNYFTTKRTLKETGFQDLVDSSEMKRLSIYG